MRVGDLVRFERDEVSDLLEPGTDNWESWVGIVLDMQDDEFCKVFWSSDGRVRYHVPDNLEVVCENG